MNEFKIRNDSWHFRFLAMSKFFNVLELDNRNIHTGVDWNRISRSFYIYNNESRYLNFCQYWRAVILHSFLSLSGWIVLALSTWFFLSNLIFVPKGVITVGAGILVIGIVFSITVGGCLFLEKSSKERNKEPGLIRTWYRSKKEKFCPTISFEGNEK